MKLRISKTTSPKKKPNEVSSFGEIFTDHMFLMDYEVGIGWKNHRIVPYGKLELDPGTTVLHYGQGVFEGLKAYKDHQGIVRLFRPRKNFERFNRSAKRLAMPEVDIDDVMYALKELVILDSEWIPTAPGTSLYIRPFMLATDITLNLHNSKYFTFIIILSPSGAYYKSAFTPVTIEVEKDFVRAVRGGLGEAKTMANYAAGILASSEAQNRGYNQILWLDGIEKKYIEEVGSMNIMFKIGEKVITPALNGSILPGITRDSILEYLHKNKIETEERKISIDEIVEASETGQLEEIFGVGTAAVISPVDKLIYGDKELKANSDYQSDSLALKIFQDLTDIQYGRKEDPFDWTIKLND